MNSLAWVQRADDMGVPLDTAEMMNFGCQTGADALNTALILPDWHEDLAELKYRTLATFPQLRGMPVLSVPVDDVMLAALSEASSADIWSRTCLLDGRADVLLLTFSKREAAVSLVFNTNQPGVLGSLLQWQGLGFIPIVVHHLSDGGLVNCGLVRLPFPEGMGEFFARTAARQSGFDLSHVVLALHYAESQKGHDLPTQTQLTLVTEATAWHQTQIALAMYQVFTGRG